MEESLFPTEQTFPFLLCKSKNKRWVNCLHLNNHSFSFHQILRKNHKFVCGQHNLQSTEVSKSLCVIKISAANLFDIYSNLIVVGFHGPKAKKHNRLKRKWSSNWMLFLLLLFWFLMACTSQVFATDVRVKMFSFRCWMVQRGVRKTFLFAVVFHPFYMGESLSIIYFKSFNSILKLTLIFRSSIDFFIHEKLNK